MNVWSNIKIISSDKKTKIIIFFYSLFFLKGTLVRSDRKTSLKPVTIERIPKFVIDACGHLPIYQVEIDELKADSLKNMTMENYKMNETTDVEK